ncbi:MAG: CHASE2 domain-containing protein, partial [Candidatus Eremiobacterota bacterium]
MRQLRVLAAIAAVAAALTWPFLQPRSVLGLKARDTLFAMREVLGRTPPVSKRIVVVAIDELTVRAERLQKPMALWGDEHARVVRALTDAGAAVVVLDVIQPYERADVRSLGLALHEARAVLAVDLDDSTGGLVGNPQLLHAAGDAVNVAGLVRFYRDRDGLLRRASFVHPYAGGNVLTLWFQGARQLLGISPEDFARAFRERTSVLALPGRTVPLVGESMFVNYAGPDRTMARVSYIEVLERDQDREWLRREFEGRLVFVGVTVADMQDFHLTPMGGARGPAAGPPPGVLPGRRHTETHMAGVEINAQAANTLVTGA